ncbi:hypothetical protein GOBAR_AA05784 [Gossypium barbadense]|uniref:Retrotransposon gag domain-containing protein n=1 Tax=Gossypium barbadense TaxID=3634 RepID=A0A2P5YGR9_GOSBA|nr:hypothetical protein GOBAR_AA05784 [Gossypium barbadense]
MSDIVRALQRIAGANADLAHQDKTHRWWMTIERGTTLDCLTWDFFLASFWRKFMDEQYLEARRLSTRTEVFDELVEKARVLETLGDGPKAASSGAVKRSTEATSGFGCKGQRSYFGRSGRRVAGGREHHMSDCPMRANIVHDQPIVTVAPALAQGRVRGRGDGGRGTGQCGIARCGDSGPTRVSTVGEPQFREATDFIAGRLS